ncbi:MAG: hypothetical protein QM638_01140 [Nocardioides sp.]|uniref:hypothetical protein n=1 Tax=Nocardioides sp. TaxID=35761 RepID=UPI0039E2863C
MIDHVIGIDPGPIPGIVMLTPKFHPGGRTQLLPDVVQCSASTAPVVLYSLLNEIRGHQKSGGRAPALVQIERFVVGRASMRGGKAGEQTRDLIGRLQREADAQPNVSVVMRSANEVKAWATDARLEAAGLLEATKGMRHAKDACRHALFAAVKDGGIPDPLSRRNS